MAEVLLFTGTARSGRACHMDELLRSRRGEAILILPTRYAANRRLERVLREGELDAAWGRSVLAFEDFASLILRAEGIPVFAIQELERRLLVDGVVRKLAAEGKLSVLGDAAASPGFIKHILHVITQLKQAAIDPAHFRQLIAGRKRASWLDAIVAQVYEGYQARLLETRCYDHVGIYWQAEVAARKDRPRALEHVSTVLFDDFDDFTASEFRLVESIAVHVSTIAFGLPFNRDVNSQKDVYGIPHETADRIQRTFRITEQHEFPEPVPRTCAEYLATEIFWRSRPQPDPGLERNVELLACPDLRQEIEIIGRRVKSLMLDRQVSAERIAVVFRTPADVVPLVRSVFREFQIPVHVQMPSPLIESAPGAFLVGLLEAADLWARDAVLDILASPCFPREARPGMPLQSLYPLLARRAGIIEGFDEWVSRVERLIDRLERGGEGGLESLTRQAPEALEAAKCLLIDLRTLAGLLEPIPESGLPRAFVAPLESAVRRIEQSARTDPGLTRDALAVRLKEAEAISEVLGRLDAWYERDRDAAAHQRQDIMRTLRSALAEAGLPRDVAPPAVLLLGVDALRHRDVDYVFLGGLNEGEFPRPPALGAIYTEADLQDFKSLDVRFQDSAYHASKEMLLFRHAAGAAKRALIVTWHERTQEGRAASQSPFLIDTLELLNACGISAASGDATAFAPRPAEIASTRDLRNSAFTRCPRLRTQFPSEIAPVLVAQRIEEARQDKSPFGPYDGMLADFALREELERAYGPDHEFSVNQLETYAECPFRFYMERILGVLPEEEPGTEFDPRVRGIILHEVLQRFHTSFLGQVLKDVSSPEAESVLRNHLDSVFEEHARRSINTPRAMLGVEKTRMGERLNRYLRIQRDADDETWRPLHLEVSFGKAGGAPSELPSRNEPFALATPGGTVQFSGRIDRIDVNADGDARIIDYKTTVAVQPADLKAGLSLQMPVYAMALQECLMPGVTCAEARLIEVGTPKSLEALKSRDVSKEERAAFVREKIAEYVEGIRSGAFPPLPYKEQCRDCAGHRPCRFESGRVERKLGATP